MIGCRKAIVWDLDGTLVDSKQDLADALNTLLAEHGHAPVAVDLVRDMLGDGIQKLIERGFVAAGEAVHRLPVQDLIRRFMLVYSDCATSKTRLYPEARVVLQHFSDARVRQGICTNKPEAITRRILENLSIASHFGAVVGGDTTAMKKPDALPLHICLEVLSVAPQDAVMIGDSAVDVAAARANGVVVGIVRHGYARGDVDSLGADFLIDRLSSLRSSIPVLRETA